MILTPLQHKLLSGITPEQLKEELGIKYYEHPTLPLIGFKYNQIDSPKTDDIVRSARGTVLEVDTWNLVAQPFTRFFNMGEHLEESSTFDWNNFSSSSKEDGSLTILYHYDDEWHVNTSGSFALGDLCLCHGTWRALFWEASSSIKLDRLDPNITYLFELCSPCNQVVRLYDRPQAILIGAVHKQTLYDMHRDELTKLGHFLNVPSVDFHLHGSVDCVTSFIKRREETDPSFEGLVVRDKSGMRLKVKSATYLSLHRMADNGNISREKSLVPWVLAGETDELLVYFPQLKEKIEIVKEKMNNALNELIALWEENKNIDSQKEFAQAIIKKTKFASILFGLRRDCGVSAGAKQIKEIWRDSEAMIVKQMFK